MPQHTDETVIKVQYSFLGGAHLFKSADVPGLRAASPDLRSAYNAVSIQLGILLTKALGEPMRVAPLMPFEEWHSRYVEAAQRSAPPPWVCKWNTMKTPESVATSW